MWFRSTYPGVGKGLLVNRHLGAVRKIVLYDVTEQVDSQAIEHFLWSSASSTFLFFGDISNDYSRPEKKIRWSV